MRGNTKAAIHLSCKSGCAEAKLQTIQDNAPKCRRIQSQIANSLSASAPVAHAGSKSDQKSTNDVPQRTDDGNFRIDPQRLVHQRIAVDVGRVRSDGQQKGGHEAELPLLRGFGQCFAGSEDEGRGDARGTEDVAAEEEEGGGREADEAAAEQAGYGREGAHYERAF